MHALAAINDLISVSFHLQDYGGEQRRAGRRWCVRRESGRRVRGVVFHRGGGSRLIIAFSRITYRTRGNLPLACNVTSREERR